MKTILPILFIACFVLHPEGNASIPKNDQRIEILRRRLNQHSNKNIKPLIQEIKTSLGQDAFDPLVEIASQKNETEKNRYIAISALGELGQSKSVPILTRLTLDPSVMTKLSAIRSLEKLDPKTALRVAARFRKDPTLVIRLEGLRIQKKFDLTKNQIVR